MTRIAISFALIFMAGSAVGQSVPSPVEQAAALNAVRQYALSYTTRLPNYTCIQKTRQNVQRQVFGRTVATTDLIEEQLSFVDNREIRKVVRINGGPASPDGHDPVATSSRGEFGNLLRIIFDPKTSAGIQWERLAALNRRRVNVFAFRVPQSRGYVLTEPRRTIQVPYRGLVYADSETSAVVRIEMKCFDIPADSEYTNAGLTLDYKPAKVAGQEFILPAHYLLHFQMANGSGTNNADYSAYRRFSSEATIKFDDDKP